MSVASSSTGSGRLARTTLGVLLSLVAEGSCCESRWCSPTRFHATRPSPRRALWSTARCSLRLERPGWAEPACCSLCLDAIARLPPAQRFAVLPLSVHCGSGRARDGMATLRVALLAKRRDDRLVEHQVRRRGRNPSDELGHGLGRQCFARIAGRGLRGSVLGRPRAPVGRHRARIDDACTHAVRSHFGPPVPG
jgi:hypothetical protein